MDRNLDADPDARMLGRRSLRGNVDRNVDVRHKQINVVLVVPYVGTWIEISPDTDRLPPKYGRSLRGNVDRNSPIDARLLAVSCRSLRGNVDRNDVFVFDLPDILVVPYVGTWIEISHGRVLKRTTSSFPTWERG